MVKHIPNFEDCIQIANRYQNPQQTTPEKHLMLGNGFSIALFRDKFDYKALAYRVGADEIKNLFAKLNTSDFEYLKRRLIDALELIKLYPEHEKIANEINNNIGLLGTELIDVISRSHPEIVSDIDDEHYEKCHKFLEHFENGNKYTFNYDLLLYWAYMKFWSDDKYQDLKHDDGFRHTSQDNTNLIWKPSRGEEQNIYYLHGAMHLFDDSGIIRKLKGTDNNIPLQNQVRNRINRNKYPMFISEGKTEHKLSRIRDCNYLDYAFHSLRDIKDNLFIFGHSLGEQDDHVFYRTNTNPNLKNIFISIYGDIKSADNQRIIKKVKEWEEIDIANNHLAKHLIKNYYFYDAESADMWGPQVPPVAPCISP